jgi:purine-cytosine permease-like protein
MRIANIGKPSGGTIAFPLIPELTVDVILIIGILLLLLALLGFGGVIDALGSIAWVLLIIAVIVIAWRIISGRRPV